MPRSFSLPDVRAIAQLAREAGDIILNIRAEHEGSVTDMGARAKHDGSPVTRADHEAEAHILAGLLRLGLAAPVVAEETAAETDVTALDGYYLIDPLDGTRAFVGGGDDFSVNVGFIAHGLPVMGVLHMPVLGETYYTDGVAAYFLGKNGEEKIAARVMDKNAVDVIINRTEDWSGRVQDYLKNFTVRSTERRSSAHKLGLVAHGRFDVYPRFGPTCEWDIAAGDAILRAAGGSVTTLDGKPLTYGKPKFLNPPFIARGR